MSQQYAQQQPTPQAEDQAGPWTFDVDLITTKLFNDKNFKVIKEGATINLNLEGSDYSGTMKFNAPNMIGQTVATGEQIAWSQTEYPLTNCVYKDGTLKFDVPTAGPAFADNFNAETGEPLKTAGSGPELDPAYDFSFQGTWDGSSEKITEGRAWVPRGWLAVADGVMHRGAPPSSTSSSPASEETGETREDPGGDDPPTATWGSGIGGG